MCIVRYNEHMFSMTNICSKAALPILRFLGRNQHEDFFVREIARNLRLGAGNASESLRQLCEAGLLIRKERGKIVIYQADMKSPLLRELKVCFTLMELNPLVLRLRGVSSRMVLFGSCARGEDTKDSDIDLLIETDDPRKAFNLVASAQKDLDRDLSPIILGEDEFMALKRKDRPLYERIMNGKILVDERVGEYYEIPV